MSKPNVVQPFPQIPQPAQASRAPGTGSVPSTEEGLQLFRAFVSIQDAALRRTVINMVEMLALKAKR